VDSTGTARPLFGVSASVTLGDPIARRVVSLACSKFACAAKTGEEIVTWDPSGQRTFPAHRGPALFAFAPDALYVYAAGRLTRNGEPVPLNVAGEILSMRVVNNALEFAVRRDGSTWIVRDDNTAIASLPDATGPVMLLADSVLYASGDETALRRSDA